LIVDLKFGGAKISIPSTKECMAATDGRRCGFDEEGAELMKMTSGDDERWEARIGRNDCWIRKLMMEANGIGRFLRCGSGESRHLFWRKGENCRVGRDKQRGGRQIFG
jgi:hypothetical protein